jgi:peptidoglycan/LPS O-acetylase OafA/YrhL
MTPTGLMVGSPTVIETQPAPSLRAPRPDAFYRPELDALRFIAFLSVFICHGLPFNAPQHLSAKTGFLWGYLQGAREAGNFGVCLFFMLSSYLITELLRREHLRTKTVHLKAFYLRRTLRIWPLYFSVLLISAVAGPFIPFFHMEWKQAIAYMLFVGNWYIIANPLAPSALGWLWSISVEEQFYVVWPTMAKIGGARSITIGSLVCMPLSLAAIAVATRYQQHLEVTVWLNSVVEFQFFALGALLATCLSGRVPRLSTTVRLVLFLSGIAAWLIASGVCLIKDPHAIHSLASMVIGYELVAIGCLCIFLSLLGASVDHIPGYIIYLGKISYGLYIFHAIALAATTFIRQHLEVAGSHHFTIALPLFLADRIVGLTLTIALAALSYKYLESPWLRLKKKFTFIQSRAV